MQAYLDAQRKEGRSPDPVELAKLRLQTRNELQHLLNPPQLEEFLLRYSQEANNLRSELGQLRYFNATPDEFREIFRATDTLDQQIGLIPQGTDPGSVAQRKALEDQRENSIKIALGPKRYEDYRLLHDPGYREAVASAQEAGAPEVAHTLFEINQATATEQDRIRADTNLTAQQKSVELKRVELEQLKANTVATGQELPPEPPPPPAPAPPRKIYTVTPGDNVGSVSLFYGIPVSAIREANPNVDFNKLKPGDSIYIPKTTP
jgi:LysM repeat protein